MEKAIVKVENLSHRYSMQWAIKDINFEVAQKGIVGLWVQMAQVNRPR